jgi:hypothetical protein
MPKNANVICESSLRQIQSKRIYRLFTYRLFSEAVLIEFAPSRWQKVFQIRWQKHFTFANGYILPFELFP